MLILANSTARPRVRRREGRHADTHASSSDMAEAAPAGEGEGGRPPALSLFGPEVPAWVGAGRVRG